MASILQLQDPEEARKRYIRLRQSVRESFQDFLRNLNAQSLRWLEQAFEKSGGDLTSSVFLRIFAKVFPHPSSEHFPDKEDQRFIVHLAANTLFEDMDTDMSGMASWMEFVEFVCAIAEELRLQAQELSGQTFDFHPSSIATPWKPQITKQHFDQLFYWPDHPAECAIIFEEQQTGFYLHTARTMARKKRIEGHTADLLAAAFLPDPFNWVVTAGNDKTLRFWDDSFKLVKTWNLDQCYGSLCWCPEIRVLYAGDHFGQRIQAWHIPDIMDVRAAGEPLKPSKHLEFRSSHTKPVQVMIWLSPLQSLASASLDTTVRLFDLVQQKPTHVLSGHKKGVTCLEFCPKNQMLLSAGFDSYISIWDPSAGTLSYTFSDHECSIAGLCALPDTEYEFMSVDFEGIAKLWDVRRLVCTQSFHTTDRQAEQAGELEPLEARSLVPLSRDRVLIGGRRMVVMERDASDPRLTADWPINSMIFNHRKIEIVTPVKNDLYVWCALTGEQINVHDNVIDGNITAISLGLGERRIFVGSDDGGINVLNYACGARLKQLTPHTYEVNQIGFVPGKVLTLSTPEKLILIHDDNSAKKAVVLKRIDLSPAPGAICQFAHDGRDMITGVSDDGEILYYNMQFGKQVSSSQRCEVKHTSPASNVRYFTDAPLIVTGDTEGSVIFWSVPPLRTYDFFTKVQLTPPGGNADGPYCITSLAISLPPEEEFLYVGTERGNLCCVNVGNLVQSAKTQAEEILQRKAHGEAAEVISGRIFDSMPRPTNSPEYVFSLPNHWLREKAHRGSIERIIVCKRKPPVLLTLGIDVCVRLWAYDTGESLGTLEQGLPEGLSYIRECEWRFPVAVEAQLREDREGLAAAAAEPASDKADVINDREQPSIVKGTTSAVNALLERSRPTKQQTASAPDLHAVAAKAAGGAALGKSAHRRSAGTVGFAEVGGSIVGSKAALTGIRKPVQEVVLREDWLAGPMAPNFSEKVGHLPRLASGMRRPTDKQSKGVVEAARRLQMALSDVRNSKDMP